MRDAHIYNKTRMLPRMSWSPQNLYMLWWRCFKQPRNGNTSFEQSGDTLFQQRWKAKRLVRAYHGDFISERLFKRWYLPESLPDVRTQINSSSVLRTGKGMAAAPVTATSARAAGIDAFALRSQSAEAVAEAKKQDERLALSPVGSLMFSEVERRLDVLVFRACLAPSVYQARQMVVHGKVQLNGLKHSNPNTKLDPGDMFTVDPSAIVFLGDKAPAATDAESKDAEGASSATEAAAESGEANATPKESEASGDSAKELAVKGSEANKSQPWFKPGMTQFNLPAYASPFLFIPPYLEPSFLTCSAIYLRHPTARPDYSEIPTPYEADGEIMRLAWEWYAKMRPRMRGKRQAATGEKGRKRW